MNKFRDKYHIPSAHLQNWDYGWNASYFMTNCTANRECYFGKIVSGVMKLSNIGVLAYVFWHEIKNHSFMLELDTFVVMPNHVHGIIILNGHENDDEYGNGNPVSTAMSYVMMHHFIELGIIS